MKNKAAFFDRDGTIIKDVSYLSDIKKIELLPGAVGLCKELQAAGYKLFVVTNQSGVARGMVTEQFVQKSHALIAKMFAEYGVFFEKFYYCPHLPEEGALPEYKQHCGCRKPLPGMLIQAAQEFDLDLSQSLMFGDAERDIQAGAAAGCKSFYIQEVLALGDAQNILQLPGKLPRHEKKFTE